MEKVSILIVDDELPARKKLLNYLSMSPGEKTIYEADNGIGACEIIISNNPDIVFLDVQMPGMTGLEVIQNLPADCYPQIIFVTAYDNYAIRAFEINAVDYLLKPFDQPRFETAYNRALERIRQKADSKAELEGFLNEIKKEKKYPERLLVNSSAKYFFIPVEEVIYIEAEEKYIQIHSLKGKHLIRETMNNMEAKLDPDKFIRIHRSFIINIDYIKEMQPWSHGDYIACMKNGEKLTISRRYKSRLLGSSEEAK